jgi:PhzF family phenazine biosynthesis protein
MKIYQVDSFTDKIFKGNPAGVCLLSGPMDERLMQDIAMEMNLAETAFLRRLGDGFDLRWFTPETEEDLCGHATLASAHILWETGTLDKDDEAVFYTRSGRLSAKKEGDNIMLDFPAERESQVETPDEISKAFSNMNILYTGRNRLDYIVEAENEDVVRGLDPDMGILKKLKRRGVIVTSRSKDPGFDFVSRFFAPGEGIPEDPVTGSAHCCLGPYWSVKLHKMKMKAYQASKRGGVLDVTICGDRVMIGGKAVTVFCAEFRL